MKNSTGKKFPSLLTALLALGVLLGAFPSIAPASTDYAPAIYREAYRKHWYTSGNGHKFVVIHDMEGYYLATISYFQQSSTSASVHYCINGLKDNASDSPAGEVTQMVREAYYGWHALCWNTHSFGTEHEGFVSNPAWYTYEQYKASSDLQRHLCDVWGIAKDRNHVVGHDEKKNAAWVAYASTGLGIDPTCNTHTDPGQYWDWPYFMALINNTPFNKSQLVSISAPSSVATSATFTATIVMKNTGTTTWTADATPHGLGSQNPQDNTRWGFTRVTVAGSTAPGATNTFTFTCTAPATPAIYPFEWQMVEDGVGWFGPTAATSINVGGAVGVSDIIVDNPAASVVGTWTTGTSAPDKFGSDYRYKGPGTGIAYLQYAPNIQTAGNYNVYEWHSIGSNRCTTAPHVINYNGGSQTVSVNQTINGNSWQLLGTFNFAAGTVGNVQITDNFTTTGQVVIADGIKFVYVP